MLKLTRKDICSALQVPEHRMRAWMEREPFKSRATSARKARVFDTTDLTLLAIAQTLEDRYKLRGDGLDKILPGLNTHLRGPQSAKEGYIFINICDWNIQDASSGTYLEPGLLIDVLPDQERVTRYLGLTQPQAELALGLRPVKRIKG